MTIVPYKYFEDREMINDYSGVYFIYLFIFFLHLFTIYHKNINYLCNNCISIFRKKKFKFRLFHT
jgi:hypothetical protein